MMIEEEIFLDLLQNLNESGVDYGILGNEESCTGDSARRIGNEYLFQMQVEQNIETFKKYGIKKIITVSSLLNNIKE